MNPIKVAQLGLQALPNNTYKDLTNLWLTFPVLGAVTGEDAYGNPQREQTEVVVSARARRLNASSRVEQLPGSNSEQIMLRCNVTEVDGECATALPGSVTVGAIATGYYQELSGHRLYGQFEIMAHAGRFIPNTDQKLGQVFHLKMEVVGNANS